MKPSEAAEKHWQASVWCLASNCGGVVLDLSKLPEKPFGEMRFRCERCGSRRVFLKLCDELGREVLRVERT